MSLNFAKLMDKFFDNKMETFETAMPGNITKVNDDGTVDVRPAIRNCLRNMQMEPDGDDGDILAIPGIPVLWPGTANAIVKYELQAGDPVLLVASSRDTRTWVENGWDQGTQDPVSFSGNDLNDLMALPVRREKHGDGPKATITIAADGKVTVESDSEVNVAASAVKIDAESAEITGTLKVGGDISTDGALTATGDISSSGAVKASLDVQAMADTKPVSLGTHTHLYPANGGAPTSPPV